MTQMQDEGLVPARTIDLQAGRRAFLRSAGLMAAGAATLGLTGLPQQAEAQELDDATILNFALNLEYLEAEFYLIAAFGRRLLDGDTTGNGRLGGVLGGRKVPFKSALVRSYAEEIARDEQAHVRFLRKALGDAKVARPGINLATSFTAAARAAGLVGAKETFDAFANENNFLLAAFIFEDVGVTAYKGAARFIQNKDFLEAAAGLLAVEAYHAGEIRTLLASRGLFAQANAISDARDSLDGTTDLDMGIGSEKSVNIVPTDANGLAFSRTPQQVLNIVYLGSGASEASFFPRKLNGNIA
ncbi:ferritin-like domain-containing protein [Rhizobium sp. DKSPLA3]|uniref:Ferritin-like domain-containing protein n=1 Tax=Rhizobium quercicola TaxID=2901226 RepID=A0A9X1NSF4_9HYPH|nr:ferritin-like domain-containing protein [Rhizobium quercicola]MCD7110250.1 ferritin-like domain-containing protein [Rhizobium quercicola]